MGLRTYESIGMSKLERGMESAKAFLGKESRVDSLMALASLQGKLTKIEVIIDGIIRGMQ